MKSRFSVLLGLALLIAPLACSDDSETLPEPDTTDPAVTTAESTTTGVPEIEARDAGIDRPRGFTYGHVDFELTKVEFSNATPGTYLEDEPDVGDEDLLYVSFTAAFESGYPGISDQWDVDMFQLVTAADRTIAASGVDFASSVSVSGQTETDAVVVFPADEDELEGATFRLDDATHLPAEVPFDGPVPADPYPIAMAVTGQGAVTYEGGCADATGTVSLLGGEWDVDSGVDADNQNIITAGTKRTLADDRFLRLRVQSVAASGTCGGTIVNGDHFRLVVDGLPIGNDNVKRSALLANGEGKEFVWGYRVPVDAATLVLEVGTAGGTVVPFTLPLPADLP